MKTPRSISAGDFQISLEAGVIDREEIVQWADGLLAEGAYDDDIAEISLASSKSNKDLEALLARIAGPEPQWDGLRRMLGRMHYSLLENPDRLPDFTHYLERLWIRNDYRLPSDLGFIAGIEDDYLLARDGMFGTIEEVRLELIKNLSRFTETNT